MSKIVDAEYIDTVTKSPLKSYILPQMTNSGNSRSKSSQRVMRCELVNQFFWQFHFCYFVQFDTPPKIRFKSGLKWLKACLLAQRQHMTVVGYRRCRTEHSYLHIDFCFFVLTPYLILLPSVTQKHQN